jgi:hypothetical protein
VRRIPTDRVSVLLRVALVADAVAVVFSRWRDEPSAVDWVQGGAALVVAVLLLASLVAPRHLPPAAFYPSLTLAAVVFFWHAFLVALEDVPGVASDNAATASLALMGFAAGLVALSQMVVADERDRDPTP